MYGYKCEYCEGTVTEKMVEKEIFKHRTGFVMIEHAPIGVCDHCGYRYYHSSILKRVDDIATGRHAPVRMESIPVAPMNG